MDPGFRRDDAVTPGGTARSGDLREPPSAQFPIPIPIPIPDPHHTFLKSFERFCTMRSAIRSGISLVKVLIMRLARPGT
jgi:hypothetical protein